jgi:hypothetical protein
MMTPVCQTNDHWTTKFRLASDPTQYASQPYALIVQRVETVGGTTSPDANQGSDLQVIL